MPDTVFVANAAWLAVLSATTEYRLAGHPLLSLLKGGALKPVPLNPGRYCWLPIRPEGELRLID